MNSEKPIPLHLQLLAFGAFASGVIACADSWFWAVCAVLSIALAISIFAYEDK